MVDKYGAAALALGACLSLTVAGASDAATSHKTKTAHKKTVAHKTVEHKVARADARDERIAVLEGQIGSLVTEMQQLRAAQAQQQQEVAAQRAAPAPVYAVPAPNAYASAGGAVAGVSNNNPPASSPDTPRPVSNTTSGPVALASIANGKPAISSADGRFTANLHGVMQFDAADYFQDSARNASVDLRRGAASTDTAHARDLNDGTDFRRARIGIDGKAYGDFEYNVLFDFAGSGAEDGGHIQELWVQYSGLKPAHLRIGAFQPSFGLEDQNSTNGMPFLERPASVDVGRSISASDYREGAQLWASTDRWYGAFAITSRTVGTINSTGSSTAQTFDQALGLVGRVAIIPFKGDDWMVHLGAHGSYAAQIADVGGPDTAVGAGRYTITLQERPELRVDGTRLVSTGAIDASHASVAAGEAAFQKGPFYVQGEYHWMEIDRRNSVLSNPDFSGWYVEGSWILTGEQRKYNTSTFAFDAPPVNHNFDLKKGYWGAWEVAARYSDLDLNYHQGTAGAAPAADAIRGGEQKIFTAGVNWYLNPIVRFMIDYQHVDIDRLSPSATTYSTPVGAQIGQKYDTLSIRSQMAF